MSCALGPLGLETIAVAATGSSLAHERRRDPATCSSCLRTTRRVTSALRKSHGTVPTRAVVLITKVADLHPGRFGLGVDELAAADVDTVVGHAGLDGVGEEDEIAGL